MNVEEPAIGVLGGSGLYEIDGLEETAWVKTDSSFGAPSDEYLTGRLSGQRVVFLPRHGRSHALTPSDINYRANIDGFKRLGVTQILSLSAVGSLRAQLKPGDFVVVDQFIDRTRQRQNSFFGKGFVAHVSMADPVCSRMAEIVGQAMDELGMSNHQGGTYLAMEGPQFSTRAESNLYRSWQCDVIGMTNMPEAKLAREAEICYLTVGMVTDYDCWHEEHGNVTVEKVIAVLLGNAEAARNLVRVAVPLLGQAGVACRQGCQTVLDDAVVTAPAHRDGQMIERLSAVCRRILPA